MKSHLLISSGPVTFGTLARGECGALLAHPVAELIEYDPEASLPENLDADSQEVNSLRDCILCLKALRAAHRSLLGRLWIYRLRQGEETMHNGGTE